MRKLAWHAGWIALALLAACGGEDPAAPAAPARADWVATWRASMMSVPSGGGLDFADQTLRQVVRVSVGGDALRVRLSNLYGTDALQIGAVTVARSSGADAIDAAATTHLTFGGREGVTLPAGAEAWSDPAPVATTLHERLAISLHVRAGSAATSHPLALDPVYRAAGDQTGAATLRGAVAEQSRWFLAAVDVQRAAPVRAVVAFGASVTDGLGSTPEADRRYPDQLSEQLNAARTASLVSVVNAGLSGNSLLVDDYGLRGSARFRRDALEPTGACCVIVVIGANDIGRGNAAGTPPATADLTAALQGLVTEGRSRGFKVLLGTLPPFGGSGYGSPAADQQRAAVNAWIRGTASADGVVDFDRLLRDAADPTRLAGAFDSGDHLHPNDAGYAEMASGIDQALLR